MNARKQIAPCLCGGGAPDRASDEIGGNKKAWWYECLRCGRIVGGLSEFETTAMWNGAMKSVAVEPNSTIR